MSPAPRPLLAAALAALLTTGLAGGCAGTDPALRLELGRGDVSGVYPPPAEPVAAALEVDGRTRYAADAGPLEATAGAVTAADDDLVVLATDLGLTAYDPDSHEERWSTPLRGGACAVSEVVAGRLAVRFDGAGPYARCDRVAVVDVEDGARRWQRPLGDESLLFEDSVALGADTVHVGGECGSVLRFAAGSGEPREPLLARDEVCGHANAMAGGVVALFEDGETPDTPDDAGTGWIPPYDGAARLRVLDARDGAQAWSRTVDRRGSDLHGVVSADPLVLDVSVKGHRTMRRYGEDGRMLGHLGAGLSTSDGFTVAARSGDVLVGSYDGLPGYRAYDLRTGEELWRTSTERWLAGGDDRGLVWTQPARVRSPQGFEIQGQVLRSSPDDPDDVELVGALPSEDVHVGLVGSDLVLRDGRSTSVVPVGEGDGGPAPEPWVYAPPSPPRADGDVGASEALAACEVVDPDDLEAVGLRTDLPTPADCSWEETSDPSYLDSVLDVDVRAVAPEGGEEPVPAAEVAARRWAEEHRRWPGLEGLGEAARTRSEQSADATRSSAEVEVLAGNALVRVAASVDAQSTTTRRGAVPSADLQRVVADVAADVLTGLDLPTSAGTLPDAGAPGPVGAAPDVCAVLADDLPPGVPADRPTDRSPAADAVSSCGWDVPSGSPGTDLEVTAFAVPGGRFPDATGRAPSAVEAAEALRAPGNRYPAGGRDARLSDTSQPGEYVSQLLTVRRGNLVVTVDATAFEEPLPIDLEADLVRVARRVLDATPR